jgi:hypothetical protein
VELADCFRLLQTTEEMSMENWFNFVSEVGNSFEGVPIVEKRKVYPILQNKKPGKKFVVVVMSSSI